MQGIFQEWTIPIGVPTLALSRSGIQVSSQPFRVLFTSSGRISASREVSDGALIADAIAGSPLVEAINAADESLAGGRKLTEDVNKTPLAPCTIFVQIK